MTTKRDLMEEVGERLLQTAGEMTPQQALESFSKAELVEALVEYDSQWGFLDYQHSYENDYWLNFVVDLIMDGKIDADYWAKRMPQVDPYPELIEMLVKRINDKHLNLSDEEFAETQRLRKWQQLKNEQESKLLKQQSKLESKSNTELFDNNKELLESIAKH